ncbi:DMT family transporter [Thalassomonas viridans]|uniref:DMT family transporter n=1 Tax=Thalassomonas viridans TaxID=137584 RepID=A0AAE9YYW4_9GAMM|nr:DMT family transporter [Thalassomonas viridans]WDE03112.1 DMT family transporter [Thalassomonas viridans]
MKTVQGTQGLELVLLAAIWGASFMFMRIGSPEFGPVLFMAMRTLIASLLLLPLLYLYRQQTALKGQWPKLFFVGSLNTALPFVLFGYATLTLSAGLTSILNTTTPMFGVLVAYLWFKDKLSLSAVAGIILGCLGVYLLMYDKIAVTRGPEESGSILLPVLAVMAAAMCYAISANFTKRYLSHIKPLAQATGSQLAATVLLAPVSLFFLPESVPSPMAITSVVLLGTVCTGIAYIIFFRLIAALGPANAMSVTYLIPVFGVFWGAMFLNEAVTLSMLAGGGCILTGVALITGVINLSRKKSAAKA